MKPFNKISLFLILQCYLLLFVTDIFATDNNFKRSMKTDEAKYFQNPAEAVKVISDLLLKKSWEELASYYDLSGSIIGPDELISGQFFIANQPPEVSHPGGFWRYKHPFAPGFSYDNHQNEDKNTVNVNLSIEIYEGFGMVQRGFDSFKMTQSPKGFQILP